MSYPCSSWVPPRLPCSRWGSTRCTLRYPKACHSMPKIFCFCESVLLTLKGGWEPFADVLISVGAEFFCFVPCVQWWFSCKWLWELEKVSHVRFHCVKLLIKTLSFFRYESKFSKCSFFSFFSFCMHWIVRIVLSFYDQLVFEGLWDSCCQMVRSLGIVCSLVSKPNKNCHLYWRHYARSGKP